MSDRDEGHDTTPLYPLFVSDTDGYGYFVCDEADVRNFEQIDIEDNEYRCWDSCAVPFAFGWQDGAHLRPLGLPPDKEGMLAALRKWSDAERIPASGESDPARLLVQIQSVLDGRWAASPMARLARFVKRKFGQAE